MNAMEYLDQIRMLDKQINSKLAVLSALEDSSTRITGSMDQEVVSHTRNVHSLQDIIAKVIDLRKEINADTDALIDLREEAQRVIRMIDDPPCQTALLLRYVWLKEWDEVASVVPCHLRSAYKLRDRGCKKIDDLVSAGRIEIGHSRALEGNDYF